MVKKTLRSDVFGEIMIAETAATGWRLFVVGADGKRRSAAVPIPDFIAENEIAQYLDDVFHEAATPWMAVCPADSDLTGAEPVTSSRAFEPVHNAHVPHCHRSGACFAGERTAAAR